MDGEDIEKIFMYLGNNEVLYFPSVLVEHEATPKDKANKLELWIP